MALGQWKVFTIESDGVKLEITATDMGGGNVEFTVKSAEGSVGLDVNALFWNDNDNL